MVPEQGCASALLQASASVLALAIAK